MNKTPFMYLKDNVDNIEFNCDEKYLLEFKRVFKAVLDKVDKYFIKDNLYAVADYQPIVEKMLSSKEVFSFFVAELEGKAKGMFVPREGKSAIIIDPSCFYDDYFEVVLCHEFIHYLTLGPETITYTKDGYKYENRLLQIGENHYTAGSKLNVTRGVPDELVASEKLQGGFFCEGFTELLTEKIYEKKTEEIRAYPEQVKFVDFLNNLIGARENIEDFLRCELANCVRILGIIKFGKIYDCCKAYHDNRYSADSKHWTEDCNYLHAQDLVCETVVNNILSKSKRNPDKFSVKEYLRVVNCILTLAPTTLTYEDYFGRSMPYIKAIEDAGDILIDNLKGTFANEEKYRELLNKTIEKEFMHKKEYFAVSPKLDFVFKKSKEGLTVSFKEENFVDCDDLRFRAGVSPSYFPNYIMKVIKTRIDNNDVYEIRATGRDMKEQKEQVIIVECDEGVLLIEDVNNGENISIDFDEVSRRKEREINENIALLDNFRYCGEIERILKENASMEPQTIKKVKASNGEEYFVVNGKGNSAFYKIEDNRCRKVKVRGKEKIEEREKRFKTKEDSLLFYLDDGSAFVRYFDNMGTLQIGQQVETFSNLGKKKIKSIDNKTIYNSNNEDIKEIFSCKRERVRR